MRNDVIPCKRSVTDLSRTFIDPGPQTRDQKLEQFWWCNFWFWLNRDCWSRIRSPFAATTPPSLQVSNFEGIDNSINSFIRVDNGLWRTQIRDIFKIKIRTAIQNTCSASPIQLIKNALMLSSRASQKFAILQIDHPLNKRDNQSPYSYKEEKPF